MKKVQDHYFHKAKKENYAARSVYKLQEINQRSRLFQKGSFVLDLGCAPGSWLQYVAQTIGPQGLAIGIDQTAIEIALAPQVHFLCLDIFQFKKEAIQAITLKPLDAVLSDMAPKTTGIKEVDHQKSLELCLKALEIAQTVLKEKGHFVCKLFQGEDEKLLLDMVKKSFKQVKIIKPDSSRKESVEIFVVGLEFR